MSKKILVVVILTVFLFSGCIQTKEETGGGPSTTVTTLEQGGGPSTTVKTQQATGSMTPTEVYENYLMAVKSGDFNKMMSYASEEGRKKIEGLTEEQRQMALQMLQGLQPKDVKVRNEKIEGDTAVLSVAGTSALTGQEQINGKVTLVKENGEWKIVKEEWSSTLSQ